MIEEYSEVHSKDWTYNTLQPPKITLKNVYLDSKWHLKLYKDANLPVKTRLKFICLRLIQRINYNKGWKDAGTICKRE